MPSRLTTSGDRAPVTPTGSAGRGSFAGLVGAAVTAYVISNYPNQTEISVAAGAAAVAFLTGLGNAARNQGGLWETLLGWVG